MSDVFKQRFKKTNVEHCNLCTSKQYNIVFFYFNVLLCLRVGKGQQSVISDEALKLPYSRHFKFNILQKTMLNFVITETIFLH